LPLSLLLPLLPPAIPIPSGGKTSRGESTTVVEAAVVVRPASPERRPNLEPLLGRIAAAAASGVAPALVVECAEPCNHTGAALPPSPRATTPSASARSAVVEADSVPEVGAVGVASLGGTPRRLAVPAVKRAAAGAAWAALSGVGLRCVTVSDSGRRVGMGGAAAARRDCGRSAAVVGGAAVDGAPRSSDANTLPTSTPLCRKNSETHPTRRARAILRIRTTHSANRKVDHSMDVTAEQKREESSLMMKRGQETEGEEP
jgi:hypothetical protein